MDYASPKGPGLAAIGREQARAAGSYLKAMGAKPDFVFTSDYPRAIETAQEIQAALGSAVEPAQWAEFRPDGDAEEMRRIVLSLPPERELLVVGHMCSIGELARALCVRAPVMFLNCTAVVLEGAGDTWRVVGIHDCGRDVQ